MENVHILDIFQGIQTLIYTFGENPAIAGGRIFLIFFGFLMIYLGRKGVLEPLLMIPMGLGMSTINASVMFFDPIHMANKTPQDPTMVGTLFVDPNAASNSDIMTLMQIDWLQPIYTLMFSNGLVACLVFIGIGTLLDVGFIMARPYASMFLALCAELGTILTLPIATLFGFDLKEASAIALVGGADGPIVLMGALKLCPDLFVPITVVAYLYLGLAYGGYPYLIKLMVPKEFRGIANPPIRHQVMYTPGQKIIFATACCTLFCFLLPMGAPLFFSLFLGVVIRESQLKEYNELASKTILYSSTLTLGGLLGILCEAGTIFRPDVLPLLLLGMLSLLLSGIGGILGGYIMWALNKGKYNPVIGIAGVSCVPTTAKVAQKCVAKVNPGVVIMHYALGANISGVITTSIIGAVYIGLLMNR